MQLHTKKEIVYPRELEPRRDQENSLSYQKFNLLRHSISQVNSWSS